MNSKIAKKIRQVARRMGRHLAHKDMELYQSLPVMERLKVAFRIVFKC